MKRKVMNFYSNRPCFIFPYILRIQTNFSAKEIRLIPRKKESRRSLFLNMDHRSSNITGKYSEYNSNFRDPLLSSYKNKFIYPILPNKETSAIELYELGNKLIPRPIKNGSTHRTHYQSPISYERRDTTRDNIGLYSTDSNKPKARVDVDNFGCEKYLDIYATRKILDHRKFEPDEQRTDAITLWDWIGTTKVRGKTVPIDDNKHGVLNERGKFTSRHSMHFVPNRGLLSEAQEQYSHK